MMNRTRSGPSGSLITKHDAVFAADSQGYFSENSMIRKMGREGLILLGAGRAVLLQIAHPLIAAGVRRYSQFQRNPLARFVRTMHFMHTLVFGSRHEAAHALAGFERVHKRVRGTLKESIGFFEAGTRFHGGDPKLSLWVFATLVDSGLLAYQRFVRPIDEPERRAYYRQSHKLGTLMGIPAGTLPKTLQEFQAYFQHMLVSDRLCVSADSRVMAQQVLYPKVGLVPSISAGFMRLATSGLLPERFRRAYGLEWTWREKVLLQLLSAGCRVIRPIAPASVWQGPLHDGALARFLLRELPLS